MNLKYVLYGLSVGLLVTFFTTCQKDSNPTEPDPEDPPGNAITEQIDQDAQQIIQAFESGDFNQVKNQLTEGALAKYGNDLENESGKYTTFAAALENKVLIAHSNYYAEYEIEIDGAKYTVAFFKESESSTWKLVRM